MTGDDGWVGTWHVHGPRAGAQLQDTSCWAIGLQHGKKDLLWCKLEPGKTQTRMFWWKISENVHSFKTSVCFDQLHNADAAQKSWIEIVPAASEMPPPTSTVFF